MIRAGAFCSVQMVDIAAQKRHLQSRQHFEKLKTIDVEAKTCSLFENFSQ